MQIALQQVDLGVAPPAGAERCYVGERFCSVRYLRLLNEFRAVAQSSPTACWLCTPAAVRESELDLIAGRTLEAAPFFEGVLVGDPGLGRLLAGRMRLGYMGYISNLPAARMLIDSLGVELLRVFPPAVETIEALAAETPLELVVHGRLPLSTTPRCLTREYLGCPSCERPLRLQGYAEPLELKGNTLYSERPVQAFGIIPRLSRAGVRWAVVEGLGMTHQQFDELSSIYRGERPPPSRLTSGLYFSSPASGIDSPPWMQLIDLDRTGRQA